MALSNNFVEYFTPISTQLSDNIIKLLWDKNIKEELFRRWTQGFLFSADEPTALVQVDGGPCAVIAPVQAYVLKNLLFGTNCKYTEWKDVSENERNRLLCMALRDILALVAREDNQVTLVQCNAEEDQGVAEETNVGQPHRSRSGSRGRDDSSPSAIETSEEKRSPRLSNSRSGKRRLLNHHDFHASLRYQVFALDNVLEALVPLLPSLLSDYGVLLFLYSVIVTKGIDQIKNEMEEPNEPLIVGVHGHGSQSLINLLLTGKAVSNVWDEVKEVSGLKLYGISHRSTIGFLTLMEHLRYCEVGWNLKNPKYPIWLLASEMHLTVLFSNDRDLLSDDTEQSDTRKAFLNFDTGGAGFISTENFSQLLSNLGLVTDPEYVQIMREKLDPEQLGIITLTDFMTEFCPGNENTVDKHKFLVFHYNGLRRSPDVKVAYAQGEMKMQDIPDVITCSDDSPIRTCLMTKWPTVELTWPSGAIPSLN